MHSQTADETYRFIRNDGQWEGDFAYRARLNSGELYVRGNGFVWDLWDMQARTEMLEKAHHQEQLGADTIYRAHAIFQEFIGAAEQPLTTGWKEFSFYYNYYQGSDPQRWKQEVPVSAGVSVQNLYPGVDILLYTSGRNLKYDLLIAPGTDIAQVRWKYSGADDVELTDEGALRVQHSLGYMEESQPEAYQLIDGDTVWVDCEFILKKGKAGFKMGTYREDLPLVIDPALIFSTFSGSNNDNFGYTATYDYNGSAYGGGIVFGSNPFPGQPGAYQATYGGGNYDVMIGKFNAGGTQLQYYTFLGGSRGEMPYSLVVNSANELYILGVTGSSNFPIAGNAYQSTFQGGTNVNFFGGGQEFGSGSDLFVTKLSPNGTALLGSTYIGGTSNDGINAAGGLKHNYADEFRGEIIVDAAGNCYIASTTVSANFPTVTPAQPAIGGGQDAVVFKLSSGLNNLLFSTFLGGTAQDAAYSIQQRSNGELYVTGGTTSANFPVTPGAYRTNNAGGTDGFIARLSPNGSAIMNATFLGTTGYDQSYILQMDQNEDIFVVGQTTGNYPVQNGPLGAVYSNPNSGQFIHKLNQNLSATLFSTVFGRGVPGQIDIVPTAFLVDICNHIYVAGWGGAVNSGFGGGSTSGMPITNNAHQSSTDGSDFYFIVLDEDATSLIYASFFGGPVSDEHVDGGTSRFDKSGVIYEAVCAGCGGHSDFPTTPGAHSATNNSFNCNLGLFKFDVSEFSALISPQSPTVICENGVVTLNNISSGGDSFFWDFGDGTTSTQSNVTHTYANPGTYTVMLIVTDNDACIPADTAFLTIVVDALPNAAIDPVNPLCLGGSLTLNATGGNTYVWAADPTLSNVNIHNPVVTPLQTTTYNVTVSNNCGSANASITVPVASVNASVSPDATICIGGSTQLNASGSLNYQWSPATGLDNPNTQNPNASPVVTTTYIVTVSDNNNCSDKDTVVVTVDVFPVANAGPDDVICEGNVTILSATGGTNYQWSPATGLSNPNAATTNASPVQTTNYIVAVSNTCGTDQDTVTVRVIRVNSAASPDTIICPGDSAILIATGGSAYAWSPAAYVSDPAGDTVFAFPPVPTYFVVSITDTNGCTAMDSVFVDLFPTQHPALGPSILIEFGDMTQLFAHGNGSFVWSPDSSLSCGTCNDPIAQPFTSTLYNVVLTDTNGCKFSDSIYVFVEGSLYVPNTFTPNNNNLNDIFRAYGVEINEFEMRIFTRWGEEIFYTDKLDHGWDGTYKGSRCPQGVYVWKIDYTQISGKKGKLIGHVNLLP